MTPRVALSLLLMVLALVAAPGCTRSSADATEDGGAESGQITITGSSTCAPLISEIARRFESAYPDVRIDVQTGGSSRGINDVAAGLAEIGMSSRDLIPKEHAGCRATVFARDGVCFIVHADNPVMALTNDELRKIYIGAISNWKDVGGLDAPITVINRAEGRSELELVTEYFQFEKRAISADAIAGENQQGIKQVATDPNAIVYMSIGTSEYEVAHGTSIKILPLQNIAASSATIADGSYDLARPLLFVTTSQPSPLVEAFIAYARSDEVHDLVLEYSFVPVTP